MDESCLVDDEETVVEFVGHLDRERAAVLRVEPRHIESLTQRASGGLYNEN